ncbi:MAG TPA: hypothetical protein VK528_00845 [Flavobacterium sp.]|nr:hypothetical protein [Flavobacterium sp.]
MKEPFVFTYRIHSHTRDIFQYLTDMQKLATAHPLVTSVDELGDSNYRFHVTLTLGFIPIYFTCPVTLLESDGDKNTLRVRVTLFKYNTVEIGYRMIGTDDFSLIEESMHYTSLPPMKHLMSKYLKKVHYKFYKKIDTLEGNE